MKLGAFLERKDQERRGGMGRKREETSLWQWKARKYPILLSSSCGWRWLSEAGFWPVGPLAYCGHREVRHNYSWNRSREVTLFSGYLISCRTVNSLSHPTHLYSKLNSENIKHKNKKCTAVLLSFKVRWEWLGLLFCFDFRMKELSNWPNFMGNYSLSSFGKSS